MTATNEHQPIPEYGVCALCGGPFEHYGNNPDPLGELHDRVCDDCNGSLVIPARMNMFTPLQLTALRTLVEH